MSLLSHAEIEELLGVFALDAVDADERDEVERHLHECPRCRSEVAGHREVAALLGNRGGEAPEGLWDRISGQLHEAPPPMRLQLPVGGSTVIPLAARRRRPSWLATSVLGAAAAVAIAVLGGQVLRQQDQLDRFESAIEDGSLLSAANVALRDPDGATFQLRSEDGVLTATAVILPDGTGYLMANALPGLEGARTYQLWGQTEGGLISLGLMGGEPGAIIPFHADQGVAALAVTAEEPGGVIQSENPPVVIGELS